MARGGRGDITGNVPGQGFTSPSPCTHVQGAYGAPTGAVGGCRKRSSEHATDVKMYHHTRFSRGFLRYAHSVGGAECGRHKNREGNRNWGPERRVLHALTTVGGTTDGTRRSTVSTLNMGTWAGTGKSLACDIVIDVPLPPLAIEATVEHMVSHT